MNALQSVFSEATLTSAWGKYRSRLSKTTAVGIDGVKRDDFATNIKNEIAEIVALARTGKYVFKPLRPYAIPKTGGKTRLINVPTIRDRFVQRVLLDFLIEEYGLKWKIPNSFTSMGIEGEGVHSILQRAAQEITWTDYVVKADLSKYFDTIDRVLLKDMLRKRVRQRSLHPILCSVVDCETATNSHAYRAIVTANGIQTGRGIRQGMPLSPVYSYLFLSDIDKQTGDGFFRYVDDMLFISPTKEDVEAKFLHYKERAEKRGLKIHPLEFGTNGKTVLLGPTESIEFLGLTIRRSHAGNTFRVPNESKKRIRQAAEDALQISPTDKSKQKGWVYANIQRATNLIRNYRSAYSICEDWDAFERELKQLQLHMCREIVRKLHRVHRSGDTELLLRLFGA